MTVESDRTTTFQRNDRLEALLDDLNALLAEPESKVEREFKKPRNPVVFIVGAPRSGTTLTMQWLAQTDEIGYPSNLISRFYAAPYIGAKIQRLLVDPAFDFNDEFKDVRKSVDFESNLGKTQGFLAPNEFWYFWRRFIPNEMPRHLEEEEVEKIDQEGFLASLAALEAALGKPIAMKGLILQYNLGALSSMFDDQVLFIHTKRYPFYNVQSLLRARERYYGTRERWYSVRPKEFDELKGLTPIGQVAGQIYFTNQSITNQLESLPTECKLELQYESFCRDPSRLYAKLVDKLEKLGHKINSEYQGPDRFESTNEIKVSGEDRCSINKAWKKLSKNTQDK